MNPQDKRAVIRTKILNNLETYGIHWDEEKKLLQTDKTNHFRELQQELANQTNPKSKQYQDKVGHFIAKPDDINVSKIFPYLVIANQSKEHKRLWAYASSFWSVPITVGFGRRIRFFVFDRQNNKLIGIFGLCDPLIGLNVRDNQSIGWTKEQKLQKLYNCMTAYILGAIPPYNFLLGAKLVALTLMFPEVRKTFYHKYKHTAIERNKLPYLAYIDTMGAFGKSAIYNRLLNWDFVGYTKGQSHIHITANGSWELFREIVPQEIFNSYKYGNGPNWKIRVLKYGLRELGFSENMLSIGWKRGYYRCPLAENWQDILLDKSRKILFKHYKRTELVNYWKEKWVLPREKKLLCKLNKLID